MSKDESQPLLTPDAEAQQQKAPQPSKLPFFLSTTTLVILYYAACSSTMLVINKVTIHNLRAPAFVLFCQLMSSAVAVKGAGIIGVITVDALEWEKIRRFIWVVLGFLGTIFANIKVLQHANVETFITFRSSTPLMLSLCDYYFLGRSFPSPRSWACLVVLLLASVGYVLVDAGFAISAYIWLCLWYCFFTFDTVYVKHMCETVKMTNWGRVYYTNLLALPALGIALYALQEHQLLLNVTWDQNVLLPLVLSCVVGVCMSHSAYLLRDTVSATMFTIVGILCKVVTVIINCLIWDKHATPTGIAFLMLSVLAGTFYEQAPKREAAKPIQG